MSDRHRERLLSSLQRLTAEFLSRHSGQQSLITVTDYELSTDGRQATALLSIFPVEKEPAALDFARRQREDLRQYIKTHLKLRQLPQFDFAIDLGEKHRQKVEDLLK